MNSYESIQAINWSSLKHLAVSPLLYRWRIDHPQPKKPSLTIGSAIHCAILEPGLFDSRYAVFDGVRRGKDWDAWQEEHPGIESLKPDEMERVNATAKTVRENKLVAPMLGGGEFEKSIKWTDERTGIACKGRVDYVRALRLIDLKSCRDVDPFNFPKACARYLYHGQLAWYFDGCIAAGVLSISAELPYLIAVQSNEPYDVGVYRMTPDDISKGRQCYRDLLTKFVQCEAANWWPGAVPEIRDLNVPEWALGSYPADEEEF